MPFPNAEFDGNFFFVKGKTKSATVTFHILTLQTFSSEPFAGESELITFKHLYI